MNFLEQSNLHKDLQISDFRDLGKQVLSNLFANLPAYRRSKRGRDLFGKFSNIPAIVCGAGPSLEAYLPQLKELKEKALIFAGGSAMKILQTHEVYFHFGASFDPDPPEERWVSLDVPFFYQSRVSPKLLEQMRGPLLWIEGNGNYPIEQVLYGDETTFDSGWTAGNFITALSHAMGCHPIIPIGMDFGAVEGKLYATGVEESLPPTPKKDWLLAKEWMGRYVSNGECGTLNAERKKEIITSSSVQRSAFNVHRSLASLPIINVETEENRVLSSFAKAKELCHKLLHTEKNTAEYLLTDFALEEEVCCQTFLQPLWTLWKEHFPHDPLHKILFYLRAIPDA